MRGAEFTHEVHPPSHSQRKNVDAFCQSQSAWELDCAVHSILPKAHFGGCCTIAAQSGLLESDDRWACRQLVLGTEVAIAGSGVRR